MEKVNLEKFFSMGKDVWDWKERDERKWWIDWEIIWK